LLKRLKTLRNPSRKPTHPGALLREDVMPELGVTQAAFASYLGVSRLTVSEILNEKRCVSPEMAMRLSKVIGGGPEMWLRMQEALDLWEVAQKFKKNPKLVPKPFKQILLAA
jgi:addiction module HigA family antidote